MEPVLFQPVCWLMRVITLVVQRRKRGSEVRKEVALGHTPRQREVQIQLCTQVHLCLSVRHSRGCGKGERWGEEEEVGAALQEPELRGGR